MAFAKRRRQLRPRPDLAMIGYIGARCIVVVVAIVAVVFLREERRVTPAAGSSVVIREARDSLFCSPLQVIDHHDLDARFMRCGNIMLGGIHRSTNTSAFRVFVMLSVIQFVPTGLGSRSALSLGLGAGSVHRSLQKSGITVQSVEIDPAVVRLAQQCFDLSEHANVHVGDAIAYLMNEPRKLYNYIIHDLFSSADDSSKQYSQELFKLIHDEWLQPDGTLVVNFVGFFDGVHSWQAASLLRTLSTVFNWVNAYLDVDPVEGRLKPTNIMFFASDHPIFFEVPARADPLLTQFQSWQTDQYLRQQSAGQPIVGEFPPVHVEIHHQVRKILPDYMWQIKPID